jgi:hypothetical protein
MSAEERDNLNTDAKARRQTVNQLTYSELRSMAVDPSQPGAYSNSPLGEGNIGLHVHPGTDVVHVYVAGFGRVAIVGPLGTRFEYAPESLPENARGLYAMLPDAS